MDALTALFVLTLLMVKHTVADYGLQSAYQLTQKGSYGAPGGLLHAAIHGALTLLVIFWFCNMKVALLLACIDALVHYHIDYIKVRVTNHFNMQPNQTRYWVAFGSDQLAHYLTYAAITAGIAVS